MCGFLHAKIVEYDPGELHGLDGEKEWQHRGRKGKRRLTKSAVAAWSIANMVYLHFAWFVGTTLSSLMVCQFSVWPNGLPGKLRRKVAVR